LGRAKQRRGRCGIRGGWCFGRKPINGKDGGNALCIGISPGDTNLLTLTAAYGIKAWHASALVQAAQRVRGIATVAYVAMPFKDLKVVLGRRDRSLVVLLERFIGSTRKRIIVLFDN
jgi:hypothetical protein